jgi:hypothetical protein
VRAWLAGFGPGHLRRLCQEGDRPPAITLLMALGLLLRPGAGLTPAEVLLYGLHRRRGAAAYIGEAAWAARCRRLNRASSRLLSDKLTLSYLLAGSRVAAPRTLAYLGVPQALLPVPRLRNGRELGEFLRQQGAQPLFLKPLRGSQGQGCVATDGLEPGDPGTGPRLRLGNGSRLPLAEAGTQLLRQLGRRAIVQERIRPDPLLRPVCGDTCATVRLLSTCDGQGVRLLAAILKLPGSGAMVDNLHAASDRQPVALVPVDPATGRLGAWRRFDGRGSQPLAAPLDLAAIPHWPAYGEMVATLHPLDGGAVLLGWDVAVSDRGPMLVEVNGTPGIDLWQLAWGRGFGDADGRRLLAGLEGRARWHRRRRWRRAMRWLAIRPGQAPAGARHGG